MNQEEEEETFAVLDAKAAYPTDALSNGYFDLETKEPIEMALLVERIKQKREEFDKVSVVLMLDLFFLHKNWKGFYHRTDNFKHYLRDDLKISRTHAYGIIRSVNFLMDYCKQRGEAVPDMDDFIAVITQSIETIGIGKLIKISYLKGEKGFELFNRALSGSKIEDEELKQSKKEKTAKPSLDIVDNKLIFENEPLLEFLEGSDANIKECVRTALERYLQKNKK
ncbi:hypothetical protein FACS1894147_01050 [Spirochaetia bacterium]|nr:hypothetical protein FACS1894147_01050 [Spirochaetia bacterium]